jgi:hypothetical protein
MASLWVQYGGYHYPADLVEMRYVATSYSTVPTVAAAHILHVFASSTYILILYLFIPHADPNNSPSLPNISVYLAVALLLVISIPCFQKMRDSSKRTVLLMLGLGSVLQIRATLGELRVINLFLRIVWIKWPCIILDLLACASCPLAILTRIQAREKMLPAMPRLAIILGFLVSLLGLRALGIDSFHAMYVPSSV